MGELYEVKIIAEEKTLHVIGYFIDEPIFLGQTTKTLKISYKIEPWDMDIIAIPDKNDIFWEHKNTSIKKIGNKKDFPEYFI